MIRSAHRNSIIVRAALLMAFWLVLSGHFDPFHIALGLFSVLLVLWVNREIHRVDYFGEKAADVQRIRLLRLLYFIPWLMWEIFVSSVKVAGLILHPKMPIKAGVITFNTQLSNVNGRVILGNSITLTPGTVTLELSGNELLVHSLTHENSEGHIDCQLVTEVSKLFSMEESMVVCEEQLIVSPEEL